MADEILITLTVSQEADAFRARLYTWPAITTPVKTVCIEGS
jgi:hypothetical protein